MPTRFTRIRYQNLNARQKENFNFQKISAALADYGFVTLRLTDDWQGADFIAQHANGEFLKVQLKSRLCFQKKYIGRDLYIAFPFRNEWYLYPHDELLRSVLEVTNIESTDSWRNRGGYSFPGVPNSLRTLLDPYKITNSPVAALDT